MADRLEVDIRAIVREHARLTADVESLGRSSDLYAVGLTSHAAVGLMLALEDRFGVEFPERLLKPSVFASIASMSEAIGELRGLRAAA